MLASTLPAVVPPALPAPVEFSLGDFVSTFGDSLLNAVREQNPPIYNGQPHPGRDRVMDGLLRRPFDPQREVVQACTSLLIDAADPAAIINAEMGTGKTIMAIATAAVMHAEGYERALVISPPHLVYKWRREIKQTVPNARVWILNGPDTLRKLLSLRAMLQRPTVPEFFILGRVRMRMGFHWKKGRGRKVLAYSVYTGTRDTTTRLKLILERAGLRVAILRASVDATKREDWVADQVDRGVDVVLTNPELVKTGLDLLDFPTIAFMQTGFNVYTLQQAARRSWRIGQKQDVDVYFFGHRATAQMTCLELMAKKIAVSQSTSGDMPESGLDILNQNDDSIEVALAKKLVA